MECEEKGLETGSNHWQQRAMNVGFVVWRAVAADRYMMAEVTAGWQWRELQLSLNSWIYCAELERKRELLLRFTTIMSSNTARLLCRAAMAGFVAKFKEKDKFKVRACPLVHPQHSTVEQSV